MENTLFPISMEMHIGFALIALLVFGLQFIRLRKKYYLLLAIAIPCSLLAYVIDNTTFFYALGIAEAIVLLIAFILAKTVDRDKTVETAADADAESENSEEDTESEKFTEIPTEPVETDVNEAPAELVEAAVQEDAE